jgi:hypothetical protein
MKFSNKKRLSWILTIAIISIAAGLLSVAINWATYARPPLQESILALESDDQVAVTADPWLTFSPASNPSNAGFIFYPGGRINPQGYASLMHQIAAEGYLVIVPEMPINMAVFNPNIADKIMVKHPEVTSWVIAGHSVGGTMAAQYSSTHPDAINGLMI